MGVLKCYQCGCYLHEDEVVWVHMDDNHDAAYCVSCAPEDSTSEDDYSW